MNRKQKAFRIKSLQLAQDRREAKKKDERRRAREYHARQDRLNRHRFMSDALWLGYLADIKQRLDRIVDTPSSTYAGSW